jgi:branched-chain amino acid aminotransferase
MSAWAHGPQHGQVIWEGIRVHDGKILEAEKHMQRMLNAGREIGILDDPCAVAELVSAAELVVARNKDLKRNKDLISNGYMRPVYFRGLGRLWQNIRDAGAKTATSIPNIIIGGWPLPYDENAIKNGINLVVSYWKKPPPDTQLTGLKMGANYATSTLALQTAKDEGYYDALMLDWRGLVAETTSHNLIFVKGNTIYTPQTTVEVEGVERPLFLDGITRQIVSELALKSQPQIQTIKRVIRPEELKDFEAAAVVATASGMLVINGIYGRDGRPLAVYSDNSVIRNLQDSYQKHIYG